MRGAECQYRCTSIVLSEGPVIVNLEVVQEPEQDTVVA